jgi:hypothetical protein
MFGANLLFCFLSHKCNDLSHALGLRLHVALEHSGVTLLGDPFNPGEDVRTKIDSQRFHSFVFLHCAEAWLSPMCQHELQIAIARGVPVVTVQIDDTKRRELQGRICLDASPSAGGMTDARVDVLCRTVTAHARTYNAAHTLHGENPPELTRENAKYLADKVEPALLGDYLDALVDAYQPTTDVTTRYWIALAVGQTGTPQARRALDDFGWENEALPKEGIRQARELLAASGLISRR